MQRFHSVLVTGHNDFKGGWPSQIEAYEERGATPDLAQAS
jgi:hypothetical protein